MGLKPTCREVHQLSSEALDRNLTPVERLRVRLHLFVCRACRNFGHQMRLLRCAMKKFTPSDPSSPDRDER